MSYIALDKILLFGDSLTQLSCDQNIGFGITPALQHLYQRYLDVVVRGFGGYHTLHARHIIKPILDVEHKDSKGKVKLLVVFFGTNDASHIPIPDYQENLRYLVETARSYGIENIILVGPGLFDEIKAPHVTFVSTLDFKKYSEAAKQVAEELQLPFVDLWHGSLESVGWKQGDEIPGKAGTTSKLSIENLLVDDGVHFKDAYKVWYDLLVKAIDENYPELTPQNLPFLFPSINIDDIEGSMWGKKPEQ